MLNKFKPTWMVESIYHITPEQIENNGIKGVLTDLDNTLIAWNNPEGTQELKDWIALMKKMRYLSSSFPTTAISVSR